MDDRVREALLGMAFGGAAPFFGPHTRWASKGNSVLICDASTGHTFRPVALCDTEERAALIVEAVNAALTDAGCNWLPK